MNTGRYRRSRRLRVWTVQHENVLNEVLSSGRFSSDGSFISSDMPEYRDIILESYTWLRDNLPGERPEDNPYPVWVTLVDGNSYPLFESGALIELEVPDCMVTRISIQNWSAVLDRRYIPLNNEDGKRHREFMDSCGLSDAAVCMSNFYPELKNEIRDSWKAVFNTEGLPDGMCYGLIPEIRREWIVSVKK